MPFDSTEYRAPFDFATATPDERLLNLAGNLEAKALARRGLTFDLRDWECGTFVCGIGLAANLWPAFRAATDDFCNTIEAAEQFFDVDHKGFRLLFTTADDNAYGKAASLVTGPDVAQAIRAFVEKRSGK